jgi:hypothetical protein
MNLKCKDEDGYSLHASFIVRQATLDDKDAIWNFLQKAYGERSKFKYPERWYWEFVDNPFWESKALPIWIALHNDEIIGQTCAMYVPLQLGEKFYNAAWSVDTIVLPLYRGRGIGGKLQRTSSKNHKIFLSLISSRINRKIKANFGSETLINVTTFQKWIKISRNTFLSAVEKRMMDSIFFNEKCFLYFRTFKIDKLLTPAINLLYSFRDKIYRKKIIDSNIEIREIDFFEDDINEFWEKTRDQYEFIVVRDKKYLNWKYCGQPHTKYKRFIALKGKEICGYIVLRKAKPPEPNIGIITDIFVHPQDKTTIIRLIKFALDYFSTEVEAIKCATSVSQLKECLTQFQFAQEQEQPLMVFSKESQIMLQLLNIKRHIALCMGDHDWDQYPLAQLKHQFNIFQLNALSKLRGLKRTLLTIICGH